MEIKDGHHHMTLLNIEPYKCINKYFLLEISKFLECNCNQVSDTGSNEPLVLWVINFDIFVLLVAKYTQKVFYKLMLEL
jgi:hypothetical protein